MSGIDGLRLECVSNISQLLSAVGKVSLPNGTSLSVLLTDNYTRTGVWILSIPYYRPGVLRFQTKHESSIDVSDQGIYTCTIPDSNGKDHDVNVGLYPYGFHCKLTRLTSLTTIMINFTFP